VQTGKPEAPTKQEQLDRLAAAHRALNARVQELESHLWLNPEEQAEMTRLKKLKLRTKEQMFLLRQS
jgi:uncharacterized protein YdcH (DUF465 family)